MFLIRGKDDKIRAFHNVCRHRAYTITRKETGASTVLGCRYHGWSYDTTGRLVKAPQFDDVPGFDKSQNSLFEVHTHTTDQGLIFVNLNSGEPAVFDGVASALSGLAGLRGKSTWVSGLTLSGDFNWKAGSKQLMSELLEKIADTLIARSRHLDTYTSELHQRMSEVSRPSPAMKLFRAMTGKSSLEKCSLFPITLIYSFQDAGLCLALSFFPASESKTNIRYDLFAHCAVNKPEIQKISEVSQSVTKNLIREIEVEYQSISTKQGWVLQAIIQQDLSLILILTRSSGELNNTGMDLGYELPFYCLTQLIRHTSNLMSTPGAHKARTDRRGSDPPSHAQARRKHSIPKGRPT